MSFTIYVVVSAIIVLLATLIMLGNRKVTLVAVVLMALAGWGLVPPVKHLSLVAPAAPTLDHAWKVAVDSHDFVTEEQVAAQDRVTRRVHGDTRWFNSDAAAVIEFDRAWWQAAKTWPSSK